LVENIEQSNGKIERELKRVEEAMEDYDVTLKYFEKQEEALVL
jgi:hypothetical protein